MQVFDISAKQQEHKLAEFGDGEASAAQPMAAPQPFPTAPWHTTCVGEIFLQPLYATNKLVCLTSSLEK